jgi:DNA primase
LDLFKVIKERVSPLDIIDHYGWKYETKTHDGGYLFSPFRTERTPSCKVTDTKDRKMIWCFATNRGGDVVKFVAEYEKCTATEAAKLIDEWFKLGLKFTPDPNDALYRNQQVYLEIYKNNFTAKHKEYLQSRGLTTKTIEEFELGGRHNRVYLPIRNHSGRVVGFNGRAIDGTMPKYQHSETSPIFNKSEILANLYESRKLESPEVIVTEGQVDAILAYQRGYAAVACLSTNFSLSQANTLLDRYKRIALAFDTDAAGIAATIKVYQLIRSLDAHVPIKITDLGHSKDLAEFLVSENTLEYNSFYTWGMPHLSIKEVLQILSTEGSAIEKRRASKLIAKFYKVEPDDIIYDVNNIKLAGNSVIKKEFWV